MTNSTRVPEATLRELASGADLTVRHRERLRRLFETRLEPAQRMALVRLAAAARRQGARVFLVGGVVRDLLLRRPIRDIDVAVEGDVETIARPLGGSLRQHPGFGTATLWLGDHVRIDLARTRREHYRSPAALPNVVPAGLAEDLARRDFTINAMAAPLDAAGAAGLLDPFGGLTDLRQRCVRVLHVRSFVDDPTRALRAVRFAALLDFDIDRESSRLIRAAVGLRLFDRLSATRLRNEIVHILECARPGSAVRRLAGLGLIATLAADLRPPRGIAHQLDRLPGVVERHCKRFPSESPLVWAIGLALLLRAADDGVLQRTLERIQPSRSGRRAVRGGVEALRHLPRRLARPKSPRRSGIFEACRGHATEALLGVEAGCASPSVRRAVRTYLEELRNIRPDVTGRDLVRAGIRPGPAVARGLAAALRAKLDRRDAGRVEQLRRALRAAGRS